MVSTLQDELPSMSSSATRMSPQISDIEDEDHFAQHEPSGGILHVSLSLSLCVCVCVYICVEGVCLHSKKKSC